MRHTVPLLSLALLGICYTPQIYGQSAAHTPAASQTTPEAVVKPLPPTVDEYMRSVSGSDPVVGTRDAKLYVVATRAGARTSDAQGDPAKGLLNYKVTSLPQPAYPPAAKAARARGTVTVQVIVDEQGKVVAAQVVDGHPLLRLASLRAASEAQFEPTLLSGKPVKVMGVINYNFSLQ